MNKRFRNWAIGFAAGTGFLACLAAPRALADIAPGPYDETTAHTTIANWPDGAKKVAEVMLEEYDQPNIISDESLVWIGHGAWKSTVVYRDGWRDPADVLHPEVLEQTITYRPSPDKLGDLRSFDARLRFDAGKDELSFRSFSEKVNFLAINLADDIAAGRKTVVEARAFSVKTTMLAEEGKQSPYMKEFMFEVDNDLSSIVK